MTKLVPVSRERHAQRRWRRPQDFRFAAKDTLIALVAAELPHAMMSLPLAFVPQGDRYVPAAVLGLRPEQNLFVAANGQWLLGTYVPAALRCHPFALAQGQPGQQLLCIDEDTGFAEGAAGEDLFASDGQLSAAVAPTVEFLRHVDGGRAVTETACVALQAAGLIQPWNITIPGQQGEQKIQGLYTIDEAALNALPDETFVKLRRSGALPIAFCQLLSMRHMQNLARMAEGRTTAPLPRDLDLEFLKRSDTFDFGNLR